MVKGLLYEWKTKFGEYRLFQQGDDPSSFARDPYAVKRKGKGEVGWRYLDLQALSAVDAQSVLAGFAQAVKGE